MSGTASASLLAKFADDGLRVPAAVTARLEPNEHVTAIELRREHAELGSGPSHIGGDFRRFREDGFDLLQPGVRLFECHPCRRDVVDDESALVGCRQEPRTHRQVGGDSRCGQHECNHEHQQRPIEQHGQSRDIPAIEHAAALVVRRLGRMPAVRRRSQKRNEKEGQHKRDEHGGRERDRQRLEEIADDAGQKPERRKYDDGRERRPDNRRYEFARRLLDGLAAAAFCQTPMDVFDHHHRIVDHQADGDRHPAHRHQVDRLAEQPHDEERRDDSQRQCACGHGGEPPVAQEQEQDDDGEGGADEDGVAHVGDRALDELREVVGLLDAQAARQRRLELLKAVLETSPDGEDIGAHLLRDADRRDVSALAGDERRAIRRARC